MLRDGAGGVYHGGVDKKQTPFDAVMLYGNELSLIMFELLLICTVDSLAFDFVTDVVVTYLVMEVSLPYGF